MPTLDEMYATVKDRAATRPAGSTTVAALDLGVHGIGKKLVEEAAELWMAAEFEGPERTAAEASQLLWHCLVMLVASGVELEDVYARL